MSLIAVLFVVGLAGVSLGGYVGWRGQRPLMPRTLRTLRWAVENAEEAMQRAHTEPRGVAFESGGRAHIVLWTGRQFLLDGATLSGQMHPRAPDIGLLHEAADAARHLMRGGRSMSKQILANEETE